MKKNKVLNWTGLLMFFNIGKENRTATAKNRKAEIGSYSMALECVCEDLQKNRFDAASVADEKEQKAKSTH